MEYTCLSVKQPWATHIITGEKTVEVRPWKTTYRGDLMICASRGDHRMEDGLMLEGMAALGLVTLKDIRPMRVDDLVPSMTSKQDDLVYVMKCYAWVLENPRPIVPITMSGRLNLYKLDLDPVFLPEDYPFMEYLMDSQHFWPDGATAEEIARITAIDDPAGYSVAMDALVRKYAQYTLSGRKWIRNPNWDEGSGDGAE